VTAQLSIDEIVSGLVAIGVPREKAREQAAREYAGQPIGPVRVTQKPVSVATRAKWPIRTNLTHGGSDTIATIEAQRLDDGGLRLVLPFPPRTKKNGTTLGIRQKQSYRNYRDAIVRAMQALLGVLELPLPEADYNIAATYYVDRYGKTADKCGLDQGLYDALENAGVVTDDWQFRTDDGTRIVAGDPHPRVELTITPIPGGD
jgi:hypothetical protein